MTTKIDISKALRVELEVRLQVKTSSKMSGILHNAFMDGEKIELEGINSKVMVVDETNEAHLKIMVTEFVMRSVPD